MGTRSVPIQKALVRTRSMYSRRMTAKIFFQLIATSLDRPGLFEPGLLDRAQVDLLELRLLLGERFDVVELEGAAEEFPPVGPRNERNHVGAVDRLDRGDAGKGRDLSLRGLHGEAQQIARKLFLQLLQVPLQDLL